MNPIINYSPLMQMNSAYAQVFKASLRGRSLAVSIPVAIVAIVLLFLSPNIAIFLIVFYFIYVASRARILKNNIWIKFADVNGWPLDTTTLIDSLIPLSMQYGHGRQFSPVIRAQLESGACDLFTYQCTTGVGKSQQVHSFTVARVALEKALPHIVLLSKKAHADVHQDLENHEKLALEGDFNNYFTLLIEKGQEIDALTIITPDVMQTLINYERAEDVEIFDNDLYFILRNDKRDYSDMRQLINSVAALSGKILEHIRLTTATAQPAAPAKSAPAPAIPPAAPTLTTTLPPQNRL